MGLCDFHTHSTASDGRLTPIELVDEAARCGLDGFAISDHDTLAGIEKAAARSSELGLFYVPAVELSVDLHTGGSAHLLGYFPGADLSVLCDASSEIQKALQYVVDGRNTRNPAIIHRFRELGFEITMEDVMAEAGDAIVGRPHIAAVLVKKGLVGSSDEVFNRYLGSGKPAYVERKRLGDYRAIEIIRQAGGLPVLAHPKYIQVEGFRELGALVSSLVDSGLAGLEAYYPEQAGALVSFLEDVAKKHRLLLTGGSDFHGIKHPVPGWCDGSFGVDTDKVINFMNECTARGRITNGKTE
ncbi:MAG: PHP domain-containing protein [Candidatus Sabulitectum sp.]|nr:PHP domain-containing protein [Candidatus Sabulitectum sp.]